jgi:hypothetical protein
MTFLNKILTYLGFCPSKESAQGFKVRNNTLTLKQGVVGVGFSLILILLVGANSIYAGAVTVDAVLRLFCLIVGGIIFVIVIVGGLIMRARMSKDPWAMAKMSFPGSFLLVLLWGATKGFFFISPTDGWVEIIFESLAISLSVAVVEVVAAQAYFRWRKDK